MLARLQQLFTKYLGSGNDFAALPQAEQIRRQNRLHADPEYQRLKAAAAARRSAHLDDCAMSGYDAKIRRVRSDRPRRESLKGIPAWYR